MMSLKERPVAITASLPRRIARARTAGAHAHAASAVRPSRSTRGASSVNPMRPLNIALDRMIDEILRERTTRARKTPLSYTRVIAPYTPLHTGLFAEQRLTRLLRRL